MPVGRHRTANVDGARTHTSLGTSSRVETCACTANQAGHSGRLGLPKEVAEAEGYLYRSQREAKCGGNTVMTWVLRTWLPLTEIRFAIRVCWHPNRAVHPH